MKMKRILFLTLTFLMGLTNSSTAQNSLDLSGQWEVSLDSLSTFQAICLPGTTDLAGLGTPNRLLPKMEKPQLLHLTRKHSFIGAAWYRRQFTVPKSMAKRPLTLSLERVLWQSQVWIDGMKHAGAEESLTTPHEYFFPKGLEAGTHELLLRIDNRKQHDINSGELAHAYTEDTQVKWNGVLGRMELKAENAAKIQQVRTFPDIVNKQVKVEVTLVRIDKKTSKASLDLLITEQSSGKQFQTKPLSVKMDRDTVCVEQVCPLGENITVWDEFSPALYALQVNCRTKEGVESKKTSFGMREIAQKDGFLTINGNRIFLRGTLECCIFPLTGNPPTDEAGWEKVFAAAKAWGLNHLRFHSYCPPEAAFRVADRMGFYLQIELPNWSLSVGKDEATSRFFYSEYDRIVAAYGNHPSFCLMSVGNELQPDFEFLNRFVHYMKQQDNRHLYTTSTFTFEKGHGGHPEPEDEFFVTQWTDKGWVRGQGIFDEEQPNFNKDYRNATTDVNVPLISHEIGQYAVYPNLKEIEKYKGTLDPLNFKAVKQDLEKKGLIDKAELYLQASGKLAVQLYKEEIERAMKTPKFSGFQLLGLQDFAGQGTALVGLVDAFWDSKGLAEERYFRQFCAPVTPLARFEKATWSSTETFAASVEIANYYKEDIRGKQVAWTLKDKHNIVASGVLPTAVLSKGQVTSLGKIAVDLHDITEAAQLTLEVSVKDTDWRNSWSVWVYPAIKKEPVGKVMLTQDIAEALKYLKKGRTVLFSPKPNQLKGLEGKFLPVFWSPVHFPKQAGTMGLLCHAEHPALKHFPTAMHSDWQWWNLVKQSKVLVIDSLPHLQPIVEVVDNFTNNRRLAAIFEAKCGKGKLVMSAMDLLSTADNQPEKSQLLYSLLKYMNGADFNPSTEVDAAGIQSLLLPKEQDAEKMGATSIYE